LEGKTVIITGGSSGIGKACAIRFAAEGANVVIASRSREKLDATVNDLKKYSERVITVVADVSKFSDCEKIINETLTCFGSIDILINNAGISMRGMFAETNLEVITQVMNTNFWGAVYCTKLAMPHLLKSKGSLVGISSIAGRKGLPGRSAYSASKFAMEGFLETLRIENMKTGLHVLIARPGFTSSGIRNAALGPDGTPQIESPLNEQHLMSANLVANHIFKAVQYRKRGLILTVQGKLIVWLNKFFPSFVDRMIYQHMAKEPGSPFKP